MFIGLDFAQDARDKTTEVTNVLYRKIIMHAKAKVKLPEKSCGTSFKGNHL